MKKILSVSLLALVSFTFSCQKDESQISQYRDIEVTDDLTIGRVLFYDNSLSVDNRISCASCHKQAFGFADNKAFSDGFGNKKSARNSIAIANLGSVTVNGFVGIIKNQKKLFWDGREENLNQMMLQPIVNHREMGILDIEDLCKKLEKIDYYQELFLRDYGRTDITAQDIANELERFVSSINTTTKFDLSFNGLLFTDLEKSGQSLFFNKYNCGECHQESQPGGGYHPQPGDTASALNGFANIGLPNLNGDQGLGGITNNPGDDGRFRIPPLRNISLTAPYMHDGSISSLEGVIDHYSHGIGQDKNLDQRLRDENGAPKRFNISSAEKKALVAFLHTMTDWEMTTDKSLSDPFILRDF